MIKNTIFALCLVALPLTVHAKDRQTPAPKIDTKCPDARTAFLNHGDCRNLYTAEYTQPWSASTQVHRVDNANPKTRSVR